MSCWEFLQVYCFTYLLEYFFFFTKFTKFSAVISLNILSVPPSFPSSGHSANRHRYSSKGLWGSFIFFLACLLYRVSGRFICSQVHWFLSLIILNQLHVAFEHIQWHDFVSVTFFTYVISTLFSFIASISLLRFFYSISFFKTLTLKYFYEGFLKILVR